MPFQNDKPKRINKKGFYYENTVEITLPNGTKARVNKFEADALKKKLKTEKMQKKFGKAS